MSTSVQIRGQIEFAISADQLIEGERAIPAAGIGRDPYRSSARKTDRLKSPCNGLLAGECGVGGLAEKADKTWRIPRDLLFKMRSGRDEVLGRQLMGSRSRPLNHSRHAASVAMDTAVVFGTDLFRREAGKMHHSPEAISSSRKVVTGGRRLQSRIDPAEHHREAFNENVREYTGYRRRCAFRRQVQVLPLQTGP